MRLMMRDLSPIRHFRKEPVQNADYPGHHAEEKDKGFLYGQVYSVSDERTIAEYGERIKNVKGINFPVSTDICNGDRILIGGINYTVKSADKYSEHIVVIAERDGDRNAN